MSLISIILMDEALTAARAVDMYIETEAAMRPDQREDWRDNPSMLIMQASNSVLREIAIEGLFNDDYVTVQLEHVGCVLLGPTENAGPRLEALIAEKAASA